MFAGHENWGHSRLPEFCTAVVPASVLLELGKQFCLCSYRWEGERTASTGDREVSIPANYGWFLDYLAEERLVGWIDFVSHRGHTEEVIMVVRMMGYLYALLPVVPQFMLGSQQQQTEALGRGWIYQETAFSFLSPTITQAYVARLLANLNDAVSVEQLLALAARRMQLVPMTTLLQDILSVTKTETNSAIADLPVRFAQSGDPSMAARFLVSRKDKDAAPLPATVEQCAVVAALLEAPQTVDLQNPAVAQGILKGFAELRFSVVVDEVVGCLSVVGVLAGLGAPPIGPRKGGLVSASEVEWALRLLMRCWRHAFVDGMQDGMRMATRRLTPGLRTWGLGYLHWRGAPPELAEADRRTLPAATLEQERYYAETEVETRYVDGACLVYESGPLAHLEPIASRYEGLNALTSPDSRHVFGKPGGPQLSIIGGKGAFTRVDFFYAAPPSRQPISLYVYPPKYFTAAMAAAPHLSGSPQSDPSDTLWMD